MQCNAIQTDRQTTQDAVRALNSLQTNFSVLAAIRTAGASMNALAIPEMLEYTRRAGYSPADFDRLRIIHVAGTKGKGSTCAFAASILSQYRRSGGAAGSGAGSGDGSGDGNTGSGTGRGREGESGGGDGVGEGPVTKVGLYTSPHLRAVRERIQIDGAPLSETAFARYFWEVWDALEATAAREGSDPHDKPSYFRFLTLLAFHACLREAVDSAVFEVGVGGEFDSTNILRRPTATGVSALGVDHVGVLGPTVDAIAWHKAGIFKPGAPAFTVAQQPPEAMAVLRDRARQKAVHLYEVSPESVHPDLASGKLRLGLAADFQRHNAALAVRLVAAHLAAIGCPVDVAPDRPLPPEFVSGLEDVQLPGRCQLLRRGHVAWHIDGAHTAESLEAAGRWFAARLAAAMYAHALTCPAPPALLLRHC